MASVEPVLEACALHFAAEHESPHPKRWRALRKWAARVLPAAALLGILYAVVKMGVLIAAISKPELRGIFLGAGATFLRVELVLVLAGLWTIPVGVYVGLRPRLSAIAQPVAQIAASVPATALFPIVLLLLTVKLAHGSPTPGLPLVISDLDATRKSHVVAGAVTVFSFWQVAVLSVGLGRFAGAPFLRAAWLVFACWVLQECFFSLLGFGQMAF